MALILAFDTATPHLAIALSRDGALLAGRIGSGDRTSHAAVLNVLIQEVVDEAGVTLRDLDAVAVGTGPGSYTGLRIGVSAAKGLCFPLRAALIGLPTLEVMVHQLLASGFVSQPTDRLRPMIDARRMEVFTAEFDAEGRSLSGTAPVILDEPWCASCGNGVRHVVFGDGADKAASLWSSVEGSIVHVPAIAPSLEGLARLAEFFHAQGRTSDIAYLVPEYGKAANVTLPKT
ncbi:MAG TPA: tRNA (adenosine(37)-N6)-threonylcarbamoyltransferase complex dimerization subunit type 1 TsaB [Flavobacteriales bacterium]